MRALLAAIRCDNGDVSGNLESHLRIMRAAAGTGCDLVLFPEMSLTGSADPASSPERLIALDHPAVAALALASAEHGVAACFGIAERAPDGRARITQAFTAGGALIGVQRKRHLGEGEEAFEAAERAEIFACGGVRFGIAICAESGFDAPFDAAAAARAGLMLFPAAPGLHGRRTTQESWRSGFAWWLGCGLGDAIGQARRLGLWIALAGQAGSTVDEDFPGLAALVGPDGTIADQLPDWRPGLLTVEIPR